MNERRLDVRIPPVFLTWMSYHACTELSFTSPDGKFQMQSCSNLSASHGEWNRFCRHGVVATHTPVPSVCMDQPRQQINIKRHVNHHPLTPSIKLPQLLAINHACYSSPPISWRPCRSSSTPLSKNDHQGAV